MSESSYRFFIGITFLIVLLATQTNANLSLTQNSFEFTDFYDFLEQFQSSSTEIRDDILPAYVAWQEDQGLPAIVNNTHVVFMYYSTLSRDTVSIAGDFNNWTPTSMNRIQTGYNFFFRAYTFESAARLDYKLVVDGSWVLDSRNPNRVPGGFGENSEVSMPNFVQPKEIIYRPEINHGQINSVTSEFDTANPSLKIYTPSNYEEGSNFPTIYFADGSEYLNLGSSANILDNLIADKEIVPVIAVFADPFPSTSERHLWYDCSVDSYVNYLDDLINYVDSNYKTNVSAQGRTHIGDSLGGQITLDVGLKRPELVKNLGIHSGAFWDGDSSLGHIGCQIKDRLVNASASLNLQVFFTAGTYEASIHEDSKFVEQKINDKGWETKSMYVNEGHSWGQWRHTLDDMLRFLLPAPVDELSSESSNISSNLVNNETISTTDRSSNNGDSVLSPLFLGGTAILSYVRRKSKSIDRFW